MSSLWRWPSTSDPAGIGRVLRPAVAAAALAACLSAAGCGLFGEKGPSGAPSSSAPAPAAAGKATAAAPGAAKAPDAKPAAAVAAKPAPLPPAFNHANHLGRGVGCTDCHLGTDENDHASLPTLEQCMECHEEIEPNAPPEKKVAQFVADAATGKMKWANHTKQAEEIRFSHAKHTAKKVECLDCHAGMDKNERTTPALKLTMDACTACHEKRKAPNECTVCHSKIGKDHPPTNHDARWRMAHGPLVRAGKPKGPAEDCALCHDAPSCVSCHTTTAPADHDAKWRAAHGPVSYEKKDRCSLCHTPTGCAQCHAETPPADHTKVWRASPAHGIASEDRPERCATCHVETTCISCHRAEPPRDHTNYWRTGPGHGLAASMGRERCAACHTKDQCVECHTTNAPRSHTAAWGAPRARHCVHCHVGSLSSGEGGCGTCHQSAPSHRMAPPKPEDHRADSDCRRCHEKLKHAVNDQNCNECHR